MLGNKAFLLSKRQSFTLNFYSDKLCNSSNKKSLFQFLWEHWAHYGIFDNGVLLMYTLEGISSVANFITAYEESQ